MMRVSIALCTYNGAKYITEQLQSFANQTRLPDEVIICDDGSNDTTIQLIETFAKQACFPIRLFKNEKILKSTKNFGQAISLCSGEIIFLSDQDDIWLPTKVESMVHWFEKHPQMNLVFSDGFIVNNNCEKINTLWQHLNVSKNEQEQWEKGNGFQCLIEKGNCVMGMAMAIRRELIEIVLPFEPMHYWIHDGQLALKAAILNKAGLLKEKLVYYRQHQNQQVGIKKEKSLWKVAMGKLTRLQWIRNDETLKNSLEDFQKIKEWTVKLSATKQRYTAVSKKVAHLKKRYEATKKPIYSRGILFKEWFCKGYETYSRGRFSRSWLLLVKDILGQ